MSTNDYESGRVSSEAQQWFNIVDTNNSGKINSKELQSALVNGRGDVFSEEACKLMIGMFDRDQNGTIDINEFQQLFRYINQWCIAFRGYDKDQSGSIDQTELAQALEQMGFRLSAEFSKLLIWKSDPKNQKEMSFDQFIINCIRIQRFTEAFREKDVNRTGVVTLPFEEFLAIAFNCL